MKFKISKHAEEQFILRGISLEIVLTILTNPDSILQDDPCKHIYQRVFTENNKKFLYRIFVNICKDPNVIITGYKTSKTEKYEN
ncbi:DUF4258 domain-containing protein [Candidatus Dojkabacteria bacterium]|nr:DUF4258 domain-containing protein [Candidatus Dojkabacteria bacterium]